MNAGWLFQSIKSNTIEREATLMKISIIGTTLLVVSACVAKNYRGYKKSISIGEFKNSFSTDADDEGDGDDNDDDDDKKGTSSSETSSFSNSEQDSNEYPIHSKFNMPKNNGNVSKKSSRKKTEEKLKIQVESVNGEDKKRDPAPLPINSSDNSKNMTTDTPENKDFFVPPMERKYSKRAPRLRTYRTDNGDLPMMREMGALIFASVGFLVTVLFTI